MPNPSDSAGDTVMSIMYEQVAPNYQEPRLRLYRSSASPKNRANSLLTMWRTYYASGVQAVGGNQGDARGNKS